MDAVSGTVCAGTEDEGGADGIGGGSVARVEGDGDKEAGVGVGGVGVSELTTSGLAGDEVELNRIEENVVDCLDVDEIEMNVPDILL